MTDQELLEECERAGRLTTAQVESWSRMAPLLAVFEAIGRDGAVALIKVDGERPNGDIYTVVVSGGSLNGAYFHKDGTELIPLLGEAIDFYRERVWRPAGSPGVRPEVLALVALGPMPAEDRLEGAAAAAYEAGLGAIKPPVTEQEARALIQVFGRDDCFGLAWALLHLVESAPRESLSRLLPADLDNEWIALLWKRLQRRG